MCARECVFVVVVVVGGSRPRWHNKVRSTTLLPDPRVSSLPSCGPLPLSVFSPLLVSPSLLDFEPSWRRCFFWDQQRKSFTAVLIIFRLQTPDCISFFYIHILSPVSFLLAL